MYTMTEVDSFTRWLFERAFVVTIHGKRYVLDWDAIGAIASTLAFLSAVAAIFYSVKLVQRQLQEQQALEHARVERERILELKRLEQAYLTRIFDVADRPYHRLQELAIRILAAHLGKQSGLTPETMNAPIEASREYAATASAMLNILKASRRYRFPVGVEDAVFDRYENLTNAVVENNSSLVKFVIEHPQAAQQILEKSDAQAVFSMNQALKACTGKLIALMFSGRDEWNAPDFVTFVDQLLGKANAPTVVVLNGSSSDPQPR